jgi:hypothetical protein
MTELPRVSESYARTSAEIERLTNPRDKALLTLFRDHWWAEVENNVDLLVDLMPDDDAVYYFGGRGLVMPEPLELRGPVEIRNMFQTVVDLGVPIAGPFTNERFAFADWGVCFEGTLAALYPGKFLPGVPGLDPEQKYFAQWRITSTYPVDLARRVMLGGNVYIGSLVHIEPGDETTQEILFS